jgi:hypothetical protein
MSVGLPIVLIHGALQNVVDLLEQNDLSGVTLVGHS